MGIAQCPPVPEATPSSLPTPSTNPALLDAPWTPASQSQTFPPMHTPQYLQKCPCSQAGKVAGLFYRVSSHSRSLQESRKQEEERKKGNKQGFHVSSLGNTSCKCYLRRHLCVSEKTMHGIMEMWAGNCSKKCHINRGIERLSHLLKVTQRG